MSKERWQWMQQQLDELDRQSSRRKLNDTVVTADGWAIRDGHRMLNLASNDYLGLAQVVPAVADDESGESPLYWGSGASRLVSGNHPLLSQFESEFASFKGTESTLIFNSGYTANLSVLSTLCGRGDAVFSDRLNHASIIDGIILSRAEFIRYRHRDMNELEHLLKQTPPQKKKFIVTDAVFSMDGTLAPLADLVTLKERYGAVLYVDEAHSGGVFGMQGQGLSHALGLAHRVDIQMGTFSKAYGCYGAYVASDEIVKTYLVNKARPLIYSTALPPKWIGAMYDRWRIVRDDTWRRSHLAKLTREFRAGLNARGLNCGGSESQIVPWIVGSNETAIKVGQLLQKSRILAVAIRPPTVPQGTSRIRFSWSAAHHVEHVAMVLNEVDRVMHDLN